MVVKKHLNFVHIVYRPKSCSISSRQTSNVVKETNGKEQLREHLQFFNQHNWFFVADLHDGVTKDGKFSVCAAGY